MNYFISSILISGFLYIAYHILVRDQINFRYNRIIIISCTMLGIFLPFLEIPAYYADPLISNIPTIILPTLEINAGQTIDALTSNTTNNFVTLQIINTLIIFFLLVKFISGIRSIQLIANNANQRLINGYQVYFSKNSSSAFSFFDKIFIPENTPANTLNTIIEHEGKHVKLWHSVDRLLFELITIFCWWNPFVYLFKNELIKTHEYEVDNLLLTEIDKKDYINILLENINKNQELKLANHINSFLKNRITMMYKKQTNSTLKNIRYYLFIPVIMLAVIFQACNSDSVDNVAEELKINVEADKYSPDIIENTDTIITFNPETMEETFQVVNNKREVYKVVDEMPRFPGCEDLSEEERTQCSNKKLMEYIYTRIKYPTEAKDSGLEGQVVVKFIVDNSGMVTNVEAVKGIGGGCDKEVMRVVKSMNAMDERWVPGIHRGKKVDVYFHLPVQFKLQ